MSTEKDQNKALNKTDVSSSYLLKREIGLLSTKKGKFINENCYWDAELFFGIKGQEALTVKQLFTIERLYKNWSNWKVKIAVWLISSTDL